MKVSGFFTSLITVRKLPKWTKFHFFLKKEWQIKRLRETLTMRGITSSFEMKTVQSKSTPFEKDFFTTAKTDKAFLFLLLYFYNLFHNHYWY